MIPRVVHFVFGLRPQLEPFHLLHYLAIESCRRVVRPEQIKVHVHHLPYGVYWDLARPTISLERVEPVPGLPVADPAAGPCDHARQADVVRLDVLLREGGMYADIDTLFVRPVPEHLWEASTVIGEQGPGPEPALTNALLLAEPGAPFVAAWRSQVVGAMDGSGSAHSGRLATRLAAERPDTVRVEPRARFSPFAPTGESLRALLEEPLAAGSLDETSSVHLMAHLWWDQDRRDLVRFSAQDASESALRASTTPLGRLAQPFLPDHGLF